MSGTRPIGRYLYDLDRCFSLFVSENSLIIALLDKLFSLFLGRIKPGTIPGAIGLKKAANTIYVVFLKLSHTASFSEL